METNSDSKTNSKDSAKISPPRSLAVAVKGIKTGADFAKMMSALMSDLIEGRVTPSVGNATVNAGGKLLKVVELQLKYGTHGQGNRRTLLLTMEEEPTAKLKQGETKKKEEPLN